MYYPSIFYSGYLITMAALLQEEIKAWLYKLKIFNENPLFCLKINNNMFFNLQILWCSDFTFLPHNHWKLLLKILFLDWESCIYIYGCLLFRIWYIFSSSECSSNLVFGTFFSTSECSIISLKNWMQNSLGYGFFDSVRNI